MSSPVRIQRKRVKGWKMPENTVSVTRPGKWGNPFKVGEFVKIGNGGNGFMYLKCIKEVSNNTYRELKTVQDVINAYSELLSKYPRKDIDELRGKNLACFCKEGEPCHADVLLKIANQ